MRPSGYIVILLLGILVTSAAPSEAPVKNAKHWAFHQPEMVSQGSIGGFVSDQLNRQGLELNGPADRRTLIRRLTFDLHGLPPSPAETAAFLRDRSDHAVAALIDRLLESPRYGERWARHWLDVVRFSESQGFERDKIRPDAWHYRDYVINSFNDDKPYDRFVREQIAGDVIEPVTAESIKATGFLVAGPYDEVGNGQKSNVMRQRVREEELEDMISAVGQTFLGVTINCARCHDHKFDPIPQRDYYAVKAVFEGVFHGTRTYLPPAEIGRREADRKRWEAEFAKADRRCRELKEAAIRKLLEEKAGGRSAVRPYLRWTFDRHAGDSIQGLAGELKNGARLREGRLILDGKSAHVETGVVTKTIGAKTLEGWVKLTDLKQRAGAIISLYQKEGIVFDAIVYGERRRRTWMAGSDHFRRTVDLPDAEETDDRGLIHMAVSYAADNSIAVYRNGRLLGSHTPKYPLFTYEPGKARVFIGRRTQSGGYLKGEVEEVRLYDRALTAVEIAGSFADGPTLFSAAQIIAAMPPEQQAEYRMLAGRTTDLAAKIRRAKERPMTYAARPRKPSPTRLLRRGEVTEQADVVAPRALAAVASLPADLGLTPDSADADRRRRFAGWLTHPDNPLPPRVIVNRIWQHHFGRGLVDTPSDFGAGGGRPSHPQMLDWLARRFVADGWSIKQLHRLILTSPVYLQSSAFNPEAAAKDADNRLLWRFAPRRLEAEVVRDSLLALSGQLNLQVGGPGYRPFDLEINNTHFYHTRDKTGPEFNRRTIYRLGVQSLREPLLDSLDCPDLSTKTPVRGVTTTPLQALALMNDSFVQRQAKFMAGRVSEEVGGEVDRQVGRAYELVFGRSPQPAEARRAGEHIKAYGLLQFCWVLLNANEFIYVR